MSAVRSHRANVSAFVTRTSDAATLLTAARLAAAIDAADADDTTPAPRAIHTCDEDCWPHMDFDRWQCRVCGVSHAVECQDCGGCGFHRAHCHEVGGSGAYDPDAEVGEDMMSRAKSEGGY